MKVSALIDELKKLPPDAKVEVLYDGACRADCRAVYQANGGQVVVAADEIAYDWKDQPI